MPKYKVMNYYLFNAESEQWDMKYTGSYYSFEDAALAIRGLYNGQPVLDPRMSGKPIVCVGKILLNWLISQPICMMHDVEANKWACANAISFGNLIKLNLGPLPFSKKEKR